MKTERKGMYFNQWRAQEGILEVNPHPSDQENYVIYSTYKIKY